jgi:hypothetical protein
MSNDIITLIDVEEIREEMILESLPAWLILNVWDITKDPTRTKLASVEQIREKMIIYGRILHALISSSVFFARQEQF